MLLDVTISPGGEYIITSDRDEKIRVSHYPNAYNIHCYCLGHTDFVTNIQIVPEHNDILVSASGDGTIRVWKYDEGKEVRLGNWCIVRAGINILSVNYSMILSLSEFSLTNR